MSLFMKLFLPLMLTFICSSGYCQLYNSISTDAKSFYEKSMHDLKPAMASFILNKTAQLSDRNVDADSLTKSLIKEQLFKNSDRIFLKRISLLILIASANERDIQIKKLVMQMSRQKKVDLNSDVTQPLQKQKSDIAQEVSRLFFEIGNNTTSTSKGLE